MITGRGGLFTYSALSCLIKQNTQAVIRLYFLYVMMERTWCTLVPVRVCNHDCAKKHNRTDCLITVGFVSVLNL